MAEWDVEGNITLFTLIFDMLMGIEAGFPPLPPHGKAVIWHHSSASSEVGKAIN